MDGFIPVEDHSLQPGLSVAPSLAAFIADEALPGTGITPAQVWQGFAALVAELSPRLHALLAERDRMQTEIDAWHEAGHKIDPEGFLHGIGYLVDEAAPFTIETTGVDDEIASLAEP